MDCHNDTLLAGGFGRKLNADQVILYRDDWVQQVALQRAKVEARKEIGDSNSDLQLHLVTSVAEAYRENHEYTLLAMHYNSIGNTELRDKYIGLALQSDASDANVVYLRALQDRPDLIPADVIHRETERYTKGEDWAGRARFMRMIGRYSDSVLDYMRTIEASLAKGRFFSAAYYLREVATEKLDVELFASALKQAQDEGQLWWQVRALQELGWNDELKELLLANAAAIDESGNILLRELLAGARGEIEKTVELRIQFARMARSVVGGVVIGEKPGEPDAGKDEIVS
jgi:hypothetical protein